MIGSMHRLRTRTSSRMAVGDGVAVALIVASLLVPWYGEEMRQAGWAQVAIGLAAACVVPLRHRWPLQALGSAAALLVLGCFVGGFHPAPAVAVAVTLFRVTASIPRRLSLLAACGTLVVCVGAVLVSLGSTFATDPRIVSVLATIVIAAAVGDTVGSQRRYLAAARERAEVAERQRDSEAQRSVSEDRLRIARELHDTVAHRVAIVNLQAGAAELHAANGAGDEVVAALRSIQGAASGILGDIGALLTSLRQDDPQDPRRRPDLSDLGDLVEEFGALGLTVDLRLDGELGSVPAGVGEVGHQVIREGLVNAAKHGSDGRVRVAVIIGADAMEVRVVNRLIDAGARGRLATGDGRRGTGHGIIGLRERTAAVGGVVRVERRQHRHELIARLPFHAHADGVRR